MAGRGGVQRAWAAKSDGVSALAGVSLSAKTARPAAWTGRRERRDMFALMNSARFMDDAPRTIYARLLDDDQRAPCHSRTMYRILDVILVV